ncbi:hypothetical protein ACO0LF_10670 [Undibacterium sp. Di27W]|uniref:hypothetical protein n=1 Tax=Undibacterium sp. Di27W TaxID=3413036 RepID=UPI003BF2298D
MIAANKQASLAMIKSDVSVHRTLIKTLSRPPGIRKGKDDRSLYISTFATLLLIPGVSLAQLSGPTLPVSWLNQNRYIEVSTGIHSQHYQEQDRGGNILDTETGNQKIINTALRWQFEKGWFLHLQNSRRQGSTNYNGYLQTGAINTPYSALSGNSATQYGASIGYALNNSTLVLIPEQWQLTPLLHYSQHHWQRDLVQYSETYDYTTAAAGVMLQWQPLYGTVLEVQTLQGKSQSAKVSVPAFNFIATQPGGSYAEWQFTVSQDIDAVTSIASFKYWHLMASYTRSRYQHSASATVNQLQAPNNQQSLSNWMVGVQRHF